MRYSFPSRSRRRRSPWVKLFSYAFQGPGGWYIENSLTTIGGKDPIGELNRELWNSGNEKTRKPFANKA